MVRFLLPAPVFSQHHSNSGTQTRKLLISRVEIAVFNLRLGCHHEIIAVANPKGGVGKTTLTANLGALLADLGVRVLMVDADVQPTLSSYFAIPSPAAHGLTKLIHDAAVTSDIISHTEIDNLDIVISDDPQAKLPDWILHTADGRFRIKYALSDLGQEDFYDVVLVDTQGAIGPLQDAAVLAAKMLISPVPPEMLSAREFLRGTDELYRRLKPMERLTLNPGRSP